MHWTLRIAPANIAEISSHPFERRKRIARKDALTRQPKCESVREVVTPGNEKW